VANEDVPADETAFGRMLRRKGDLTRAELRLREAINFGRQRWPAGHPVTAEALLELGELLLDLSRAREAKALLREALRLLVTAHGENDARSSATIAALQPLEKAPSGQHR